jgi:hypothetical protein
VPARKGGENAELSIRRFNDLIRRWTNPPWRTFQRILGPPKPWRRRHAGDAVLELGSVPLPVVTARVDRFITENGKGPYPDME